VRPDGELGLVLIVAPTAKGDVLDRGWPMLRVRLDVVELQEGPFRAPLPGRGLTVAPSFVLSTFSSSKMAARSKIFPGL
jgi:hypothetical protein